MEVRIENLDEVRRALNAIEKGRGKMMRLALNEAAQIVVRPAMAAAPVRSGRARGNIRARSTQSKARVVWGGARVPYAPWLEFGGRVGRNNSVSRPVTKGRYVYGSFRSNRGKVMQALRAELARLIVRSGLAVRGGSDGA